MKKKLPSNSNFYRKEPITRLILETFRLNGRLLAAGDQLTRDYGLSSALWQVLGALEEGPLPVAQIARNMGLTRQSVQRSANVLHKKGFVRFAPNPDHKRAKLASLTGEGRAVLARVTSTYLAWLQELEQGLGKKELASAAEILRILSQRI